MQEIRYKVTSENGLTSKLSAELVASANRFKCQITLTADNEDADLKSIMNVMALIVVTGDSIKITIDGIDEIAAYDYFNKLIKEIHL